MKEAFVYKPHVQSGAILLNANECSDNLPEEIIAEIQQMLPSLLFNRYPDDTYLQLRSAYAAIQNLDADQLIAGNGSDQMLQLLIGKFLSRDKTLFTFSPDFGMYDFYASNYEASIKKYPLDFKRPFDMDDFIKQAKTANADLILFSNPNNPTGLQVSRNEIRQLLSALPETPVVIDEAYMEFGDESMLHEIEDWDNLYVTRTLSKAYGLAGLRVGFLAASRKNIEKLQDSRIVYNVSTLSAAIAGLVLSYADEFEPKIEAVKARRDELINKLASFSRLTAHPSKANFIAVESDEINELNKAFEDNGIAVRTYPGRNYLRLTVGSEKEMKLAEKVLDAFEGERA